MFCFFGDADGNGNLHCNRGKADRRTSVNVSNRQNDAILGQLGQKERQAREIDICLDLRGSPGHLE